MDEAVGPIDARPNGRRDCQLDLKDGHNPDGDEEAKGDARLGAPSA
jgi:hypothetical protein